MRLRVATTSSTCSSTTSSCAATRSTDSIVVEYALRDLKKPIGVAGWETKIVEKLSANLKGSLPTVEELEAELSRGGSER